MKHSPVLALALLALFTNPVFAEATQHAQAHGKGVGRDAVTDVSAAAVAAIAAVDRFTAALSAGDFSQAGAELDPDVLILESGGAERSAQEYLDGHAQGDAEFLKSAHQQLLRRTAHASGDFAWAASERELHVRKNGRAEVILSTETMLLQRRAAGWKIVHIHWSSRTKKP